MNAPNNPYIAVLEKLQPKAAPDNMHHWVAVFDDVSSLFADPIPVNLLTTAKELSPQMIHFVASILQQTDVYLTLAIQFIRDNFKAYPEMYDIREDELSYLSLDVADFPLEFPELTFYEEEGDWLIRFAEGKFENCDPFGIAVAFKENVPTDIELLDDSEPMDE
ncbi:hypothetical protein CLV59_10685 [Chitinophaga dinghuensis]|uniref:Uncharacterized protein n=1 Tax=Chitinophaga dinghuensis TaxID=1539050 RepID=A0A327VVN5_9BACT|nr:hypothetical protein [Chitinophaga dinghuensis]RAJ79025.1 hypothetical protein CLV59_10685 [Chitinophaga dinghuensis]